MNECISAGLRKCRGCKYVEDYSLADRLGRESRCWLEYYSAWIKIRPGQIKSHFLYLSKPNKYGMYDEDEPYFFSNAVFHSFPEKRHILEKLMLLQ